jgi:hypothetical protein
MARVSDNWGSREWAVALAAAFAWFIWSMVR